MPIPAFDRHGCIPEGRYPCTLDELEQSLVLAPPFLPSTTRRAVFADLRSAIGLLQNYDPLLVERFWVGGGFASSRLDPSDIDVVFLISAERFAALSKSKQQSIRKLCRWGGFKLIDLAVDGFMFERDRVGQIWKGPGLVDEAVPYTSLRGAWDDWFSRDRTQGSKDELPLLEDCDPVRGYLEVMPSA